MYSQYNVIYNMDNSWIIVVQVNVVIVHTIYKKTEMPHSKMLTTYQWMKCGYL